MWAWLGDNVANLLVTGVAIVIMVPLALAGDDGPGPDCTGLRSEVAASWEDDVNDLHPPSQRLAPRLVECRTLNGLRKRELRRLLGRPDERSTRSWGYSTGALDEMDSDGTWLFVALRDGRVVRAETSS